MLVYLYNVCRIYSKALSFFLSSSYLFYAFSKISLHYLYLLSLFLVATGRRHA